MKAEIDLIKDGIPQNDCREDGSVFFGDTNSVRRGLRNMTDNMVLEALHSDSPVDLQEGIGTVMLVVAEAAWRLRIEPDVSDFVEASQALIEDARAVLDKGLMINDVPKTTVGIVMIEIVMRGIASCLNPEITYDAAIRDALQNLKGNSDGEGQID